MADLDPRSLLISDDDPAVLSSLARLARGAGFRPVLDSEGKALELARSHRPAVVVLDIHQRGIDGRDLLARLKSDPLTQHAEVVVISGVEEPYTANECLALGAVAFRGKPLPDDFMQELARLAGLPGPSRAEWNEVFVAPAKKA